MDLMPTPEQDAIRDSVRAFLDKELPMSRVRALMGAPADAYDDLWRSAGALGFFALGLPEALGGAGYAITEEMVLFEELGRRLAPGPWLGSVLAAHALASGEDRARGALDRVIGGTLRVASGIGRGTIVTVTLPLDGPSPTVAEAPVTDVRPDVLPVVRTAQAG